MKVIKKSEHNLNGNLGYQKVSSSSVTKLPTCSHSDKQSFIAELHEALTGNTASQWGDLSFAVRVRLRVVAQRLNRVRSFGGAYGQVSLSPEIEQMLALMPQAEDAEHEVLVH